MKTMLMKTAIGGVAMAAVLAPVTWSLAQAQTRPAAPRPAQAPARAPQWERDGAPGQARPGGMLPPPMGGSIATGGQYVFVLRGNTLIKVRQSDLSVVRSVTLGPDRRDRMEDRELPPDPDDIDDSDGR